jgi:hypothetical protein
MPYLSAPPVAAELFSKMLPEHSTLLAKANMAPPLYAVLPMNFEFIRLIMSGCCMK